MYPKLSCTQDSSHQQRAVILLNEYHDHMDYQTFLCLPARVIKDQLIQKSFDNVYTSSNTEPFIDPQKMYCQ